MADRLTRNRKRKSRATTALVAFVEPKGSLDERPGLVARDVTMRHMNSGPIRQRHPVVNVAVFGSVRTCHLDGVERLRLMFLLSSPILIADF